MRGRDDLGVSDAVGSILLVLGVVLAGGGVTAIVAANLDTTAAPTALVTLAPVDAGDTTTRLLMRSGTEIPLSELRVHLVRPSSASEIPPAQWTTPNATLWRSGDTLTIPVSPAVAAGETVRVRLYHASTNTQLADVAALAPAILSPLTPPTLVANLTPSNITADATMSALLAVRVSHPMGALAVSSLRANLTNLSVASKSANATLELRDTGLEGDALGGDGVFSALLRAPANTTPGSYVIPITAMDVAGYASAQTTVTLNVTSNLTGISPDVLAALSNVSVLGNLTLLLANLTGGAPGVAILNGSVVSEGVRLAVPNSSAMNRFNFSNFTWERHDPALLQNDAAVLRILSGGYAWSAYLKFDYIAGTPAITLLEMWNANSTSGRTRYVPTTGSYVSMVDLNLNMTDPSKSGFTCTLRCSPAATYKNSDIRGAPAFMISWMRDEWNNPDSSDLGILSVEAVFA